MSSTHPFPLSNNRAAYPGQDASSPYASGSATASYPYPHFPPRNTSFDADHGRIDPTSAASISGMFHHEEDDPQQHYTRQGYPADAFGHAHAHSHPREQLWQYSPPPLEAYRPRLVPQGHEVGGPSDYQVSMPHGPPASSSSHGHNVVPGVQSSSTRPGASGTSAGRSRREKPRLELAADQPLTTQGKPRARVYLACLQCRGRKIRCDGAKPICHNCSRRTENPQLCSYDTAPKRRGPDRVPGARQRSAAGPGEKPRRRRRPPPLEAGGQPLDSPQSASTSPVEYKPSSFSPTTHSFVPEVVGHHHDGLAIIQEPGLGQYSRHREELSPVSVTHGAQYAQSHDRTILPSGALHSHTPAAAYEALPLGSSLSNVAAAVGYPVGVPVLHAHSFGQVGGEEGEYEYGEDVGEDGEPKDVIAADPGLQFTRETWWDALLVLYATEGDGGPAPPDIALTMPSGVRENTTQSITADLRAIFRASPYWLNFINLPRFFGSLLDPRARHGIQPSLILGALALATFFRSHEGELGARGRERAMRLRDQAQGALEASLSSRWVDHSLVQAAWLIAFFEICAHPLHSTARVRSSMGMLDALLRTMGLLTLDAEDPRVSVFISGVPAVTDPSVRRLRQPPVEEYALRAHPSRQAHPVTDCQSPADEQQWHPEQHPVALAPPHFMSQTRAYTHLHSGAIPPSLTTHQIPTGRPYAYVVPHPQQHQSDATSCSCMSFTLGHTWPMVHEFAPLWDMTPTWQSEWTESEIRKEECRRLVWSSVMLTAGHSSYTAANPKMEVQQLFLMDPRNYALLFPGESLTYVDGAAAIPPPAKDSVWALYMRAMLMWNSCIRMRADPTLPDAEKAQFAVAAWEEIDAIEGALRRHTCGIERSFLFQGRELLFNSRMCIAYEFQRCLPQPTAHANLLFYRQKADEWLSHLASLARRVLNAGLPSVTGLPASSLAKRPFLLFWFMSQIERSLTLWSYDQSLSLALDVARALSRPVEYLMTLWPCPEQARRWEDLHKKLVSSCYAAGLPLASSVPSTPPPFQEVPPIPAQS